VAEEAAQGEGEVIDECATAADLQLQDALKSKARALINDPGPPYLFVDLYAGDVSGHPAWQVLATTPHYYGAVIKATEGLHYAPPWFDDNWKRLRSVTPARYGLTWYRGAYHFLRFAESGKAQADFYLAALNRAGGLTEVDIMPIVDVELGGERNPNRRATAQQVIDCTSAWAERVKSVTGRRVMLYGRGAMRDLGIRDRMGCDVVWNPSYTATMKMTGLEAWSTDDVAAWQFGGDGVGNPSVHQLPLKVPEFGAVDVSVFIDGARKPTLQRFRERML
jgi:GH25 family lysozyme M1 (1,4-beta-N-acetylmuramidase)